MSNNTLYAICLDIGGTNIRGSWFNSHGLHGELLFTKRPKTLPCFKESLVKIIHNISSDCPYPPKIIGIATAGPLDYREKKYLKTANMPELNFFPIGEFLENTFSLPSLLENDAQASALGEIFFGSLKGKKHGITITLGTGVGTGIIINKKIWRAQHITGPELGHIYLGGKHKCGCGQMGCAETLLNKKSILTISKKYSLKLQDPKQLYNLAKQDKKQIQPILKEYGSRLGLFISQLQVIFGIKHICISGGMSPLAKLCDNYIRETIKVRLHKRDWWEPQEITYSNAPNLSALYGIMAQCINSIL